MKKKLFLGLLAASLTLVGCGNNEEKKEPVDPLTPKQRENATVTNDFIYSLVKNNFGKKTAEATKSYILSNSEYAATKGVDAKKVTGYITEAIEADFESPLEALMFVKGIYDDKAVDDAVYFGAAVGKCFLKASEISDKENADYYTFALSAIEGEKDKLPDNIIAIANKAGSLMDDGIQIALSGEDFMPIFVAISAKQVLPAENLKGLLTSVGDLVASLDDVKENVNYFGEFAKKVLGRLPEIYKDFPQEIINMIKGFEVGAAVDGLYDAVGGFVDKLQNLPQAYYDHLAEITLYSESYVYAVLGAVDALIPEVEIDEEKLDQLPEKAIEFLENIYALVEESLPEDIKTKVSDILEDNNLKKLLQAGVKLVKDVDAIDFSFVSTEIASRLIGVCLDSFTEESEGESIVSFDVESLKSEEIVPSDIQELLPIAEFEAHIASEEAFEDENKVVRIDEIQDNKVKATVVTYTVTYDYDEGSEELSFFADVSYDYVTVTYKPAGEVVDFIDLVLDKLVNKEQSDLFIEDLYGLVHPFANLVSEYVMPDLDIDSPFYKAFSMIAMVDQILSNNAVRTSVKEVVNDVFVVVNDFFSVFVSDPAAVEFSEFVALLMVSPEEAIKSLYDKIPEAKLQSVKKLATDVYGLGESLSMPAIVLALINNYFGDLFNEYDIDITKVKDAEEFSNAVYTVVSDLFQA